MFFAATRWQPQIGRIRHDHVDIRQTSGATRDEGAVV